MCEEGESMTTMPPTELFLLQNKSIYADAQREFPVGLRLKLAPINKQLQFIMRLPRAASGYVTVESVDTLKDDPDFVFVNIIIGDGEYVSITYLELADARKLEKMPTT
jgi:hypothetical protein